jgi:hypothetical protein
VVPEALGSVNLVSFLEGVRECFPLTSLQAATSELATACALVYFVRRKKREGPGAEGERQ